jgi:hypothetical protein
MRALALVIERPYALSGDDQGIAPLRNLVDIEVT